MEYIIASLVAILMATLIVYKLANNIFGLGLQLQPLLLCAVCSMFISLVLPKIVISFADLPVTLAVLAFFAVLFAYIVAKYVDRDRPSQYNIETNSTTADSLTVAPDMVIQTEITETLLNKADTHKALLPMDNPNESIVSNERLQETHNFTNDPLPESTTIEDVIDVMQQKENFDAEAHIAAASLLETTDDAIWLTNDQQVAQEPSEHEQPAATVESLLPTKPDDESITSDLLPQEELEENVSHDSAFPIPPEPEFTLDEPCLPETDDSVGLIENQPIPEIPAIHKYPVSNDNKVSTESVIIAEEAGKEPITEFEPTSDFITQQPESFVAEPIASSKNDLPEKTILTANAIPDDIIMSEKDVEQKNFPAISMLPIVQEAEQVNMANSDPEIEAIRFESEELDELLDFAFASKERRDYTAAYNAFSRALHLYPNSEAAPLLIVEIGNILKNKGAYDDAIKVFVNGRNLSQTRQDKLMEQEFISTIAYLRITKNMLLQHRLDNTPFDKIPANILAQIDEEFREWRNVGNI